MNLPDGKGKLLKSSITIMLCIALVFPVCAREVLTNDEQEKNPLAILVGYWTLLGLEKPVSATKVESYYRHKASGVCLPERAGLFEFKYHRKYGPDDESVTLWSETYKTRVTLYAYPKGKPADREFESTLTAMGQRCKGETVSVNLKDKRFQKPVKAGACILPVNPDVDLVDQVFLLQKGDWYFKARISTLDKIIGQAYTPTMELIQSAFNACE